MPRANRLADCPAIAQEGPAGPISGGSWRCGSSGRNVLVTGGASGIGLAIADAFLTEGARVLVADRDRAGLDRLPERLADPGRLETIEIDIAEPGRPGRLGRERRGDPRRPVDVLVNNAGLMAQTPILEIDEAEWDRLFAVNLRATLLPDPGRRPADGRARRRRGGLDLLGQRPPDRVAGGALQRDQGGHRRDHALVRERAQPPRVAVQLRRAGRDRQRRGGRRATPTRISTGPASTCCGCRCAASRGPPSRRGWCCSSPPTMPPTSTARRSSPTAASSAATGTTPPADRRSPNASRASRTHD